MNNFWAYLVGGVFLGGIVVFFFAPQPETGGHTMTPPDTSSIEEGDPIVNVVLPAELSANAQIGKAVFEAKCAVCHGENAAGQNGVAPPLIHTTYRPGHHGNEAFWIAAQRGVLSHHWDFGNMPPVEGVARGEVMMAVAYIRELQRANGIR